MQSARHESRRKFLADVGRGMMVASVGAAVAGELGLAPAAEPDGDRLLFGELEPLVALMQETPVDKLQPTLARKITQGTSLQTLVTAGALANARSFGGQDYTGFHTMMALMPAWQMAQELPSAQQPLPVFKVLYRNTARIQQTGRTGDKELLRPVAAKAIAESTDGGRMLQSLMRKGDMEGAEAALAGLVRRNPHDAFDDLQHIVQDETNVHRVVLAWRAWDILNLTGEEYAAPLLRQSVRFCVDEEQQMLRRGRQPSSIRRVLPELLEEYKLPQSAAGDRKADAKWVDQLAREIFGGQPEQAAEVAAAALAEGFDPEAVGEAISLAANLLVLHDPGRADAQGSDRPAGSVHGASVGVHASDAANAWRNIARVTDARNRVASLIVGAYHTAGSKSRVKDKPYLTRDEVEAVGTDDSAKLAGQLREAVEGRDQARSAAIAQRWADAGHPPAALLAVLREYAISEDGALHAEKYYRSVVEEFQATRPDFRWRHLVGLARVTASQFGWPAPGRTQALELIQG